MKKFIFISCLLITSLAMSATFDHQHLKFASLLEKYVHLNEKENQTLVDYKNLKKNHIELDVYLNDLSSVTKFDFEKFNKDQQLAFLINAYNAYTLKIIIDHYPISSIKKIGNIFRSTWKINFFKLLGNETNLDHIEHTLIRPVYKDYRIHFAVNCASLGCPNLQKEPFVFNKLTEQLDKAEKFFLMDKFENKIDFKSKTIFASKIFDWYGEDFQKLDYGFKSLFYKYYKQNLKEHKLNINDFKVSFKDYGWGLNEFKN